MDFDRHGFLTKIGFAALTCNSALAIYRSKGDSGTVALVIGAYGAIALLFYFLRSFERAGPGADRGSTKVAVWVLTTLLTAMFAARVAPLMPPAVGLLVWLTSAATVGGGFWALFLSR
ncbi:hypothetical protein EJB05_57417, partial [Eragrostis curvula]